VNIKITDEELLRHVWPRICGGQATTLGQLTKNLPIGKSALNQRLRIMGIRSAHVYTIPLGVARRAQQLCREAEGKKTNV